MDYAGEGNFGMYFDQDQTGIGSLINQMVGGPGNPLANICPSIAAGFKRYDQNTSSPSDSSSLVFGVYHSPICGTLVTSIIRKIASDKFQLSIAGTDEWGFSTNIIQRQTDANNPMVVQMAIFMELTSAILALGEPPAISQLDPFAIHLEVDLFTYRAIVMMAEKSLLRFRFFPTPALWQFDKHREQCERAGQAIEEVDPDTPGYSIEGAVKDLLADRAPDNKRYHIVAYCAACGKQLTPEKRSQCSQCKIAFYCNAECQKKDWQNLHKKECKRFSKLVAEADCVYCQSKVAVA
jgi:hypothetical protein